MIRAILSVSLSRYCRLGFGREVAVPGLVPVPAAACSAWDLPSGCCLLAWERNAGCACHCDRPCASTRDSDCPAGNCSLACAARPAAEASQGRGAAQASSWLADDSRCAKDRFAGPAQQFSLSAVRHSCISTAANENSKKAPAEAIKNAQKLQHHRLLCAGLAQQGCARGRHPEPASGSFLCCSMMFHSAAAHHGPVH